MQFSEQKLTKRLRIAWIGTPTPGGGVGGFGRQLIEGIASTQNEIVVFAQGDMKIEQQLGWREERIEFVYVPIDWDWGRWYSRSDIMVFFSSFWARMRSYKRLIALLEDRHRNDPFDVVIQFSQTELFSTSKRLRYLPPFLLFPCVHAAGELHFHKREKSLSARCESRLKYIMVNLNLRHRSVLQKRSYAAVYGVIGMSRRFNEWVRRDYGISAERQAVVYQPIPMDRTEFKESSNDLPSINSSNAPLRLLFVGRISVRKGIEMLVELSHRIDDLQNQVELRVVGCSSFWSNYTRLLDSLNPRTSKYVGNLSHEATLHEMEKADFLLVPSHYEPGGIVVAEAMRMGCAIIASDEVGSAEDLPASVCRKFAAGDINAFEQTVRDAVKDMLLNDRKLLRQKVIEQASESFNLEKSISDLLVVCDRAANRLPIGGC